jgi:hypothetical protein
MATVDLNGVLQNAKPNSFTRTSPVEKAGAEKITKSAPVAHGTVRKQSIGSFFGPKLKEAAKYTIAGVVVPYVKDLIFDAFQSSMSMLLYKEDRTRRTHSSLFGNGYTSYSNNSIFSYPTATQFQNPINNTINNPSLMSMNTGVYNTSAIMFASRGDCNKILDKLQMIAEQVGYATVADFYEAADVRADQFTVNNFGWDVKMVNSANVNKAANGYYIVMPTPIQLPR